jgi:ABC-2 type transport system permease protein
MITDPAEPPVSSPPMTSVASRRESLTLPKELLVNLTLRELRGKYKRSALGWGWSVINPIVMIAVYTTVFSVFFRATPPTGEPSGLYSYTWWLVCALLPWTFVSNGINGAVGSLTANEGLIKKVYFPRTILPTASTLAWLATFGIEMTVFGVLLLAFSGNMILPWIPVVIVVMLIQFFFILGIGLLVSPLNAYFRDVSHLTAIVLMIWFWLTPIVYPESTLYDPDGAPKQLLGIDVVTLLGLNPMTHFANAYRALLYDLRFPMATTWAAMLLSTAAVMAAGIIVFRRLEPQLAEEL